LPSLSAGPYDARVTRPAQIGRYRILGELGRGAMGTVYRGRDEALERDVAIKVMLVQGDDEARARFLKEGRAAARLQHPNIVTIYELGEHEGAPFMSLELLEGMDLQQAIEAGIRPDPKVTLPIVLQALAGLGHAHEAGIVHRDVKPSNIFLPRGRPAKIMDFGVARLVGTQTTKNMLVGTPNYMSPEQAKGGELDGRSDLFSVGLILYELVTGEKAYRGNTIVAVLFKIANEAPDLGLLPPGAQWEKLRAIVTRALQRKPEDRYPDARSMSAELREALRELGGSGDWMTPSDQGLLVRAPRKPGLGTLTPSPAPLAVVYPTPEQASPADAPPSGTPMALAAALGGGAVVLLGLALYLVLRPESPRPSPASSAATSVATPAVTPSPSPSALPSVVATARAATTLPRPSPSVTTTPAVSAPPSATPSSSAASVVSPAEARLDRANDSMEKGRYAQALAEAKAVLAREPGNAAAKALAQDAEAAILIEEAIRKARAALKAGDRDGALVEIRRGLAVNPSEGRLLALFKEATQ
jgi:eukaryotic-like serine/threonine-protein kinase